MTIAPPTSGRSFLCGLVGSGISRSLTPPLHEAEGRAQGMSLVYRVLDIDDLGGPSALPRLIASAVDLGADGLNITHPCKQAVIPLLDGLDEVAATLGAVNTVKITEGRLIGYNTDCTGFGRNLDAGLRGASVQRVVQVGAGGAGAAVAHATMARGVEQFTVVDVDPHRAEALAGALRSRFADREIRSTDLSGVAAALADANGVVNATPMGMAHHPGTAFDVALLRPDLWVADVVYRPVETELLRSAALIGARTISGIGMTVGQAVDAFEIFTGRPADANRMTAVMAGLLAAENREAAAASA